MEFFSLLCDVYVTRCPDSSPLRNLFTPSTHIKHDLTFNVAYSSSRRESSVVTNRRSWTSVTKTTYGILDFSL
ncbi:unnamed protein product [Brassica rapa subsp. trilocularis]